MRDTAGFDGVKPSREPGSVVRFAGFVLNFDACLLACESGEPMPLTRGEFAVLRMFVTRPGRVISRDTLLDAFTDRRFEPFDRSIDVLVGRLRKKIEADPKQPRLIVTVPGEGYRFDGLAQSLSPEQKPSIVVQASQDDDGRRDREPGSDPSLAERPATFGATGAAQGPMPEQPEATPIAARPSEGAPPPAEAAPGGAERRHVTVLAAEAVRVEGAKFAAPKKRPTLAPLTVAIAVTLVLIGGAAWWFLNAYRPAAVASKAPVEAARLSIVVLPFTNLSNDPAQDYFADGVTENLTTELSRLHNSFASPATPPSLLRTRISTPRRSARNSACTTSSKARCSATEPACASMPSSSTRNPARMSGRIDSRKTSWICSSSRTKWSRASPARFRSSR